MRWRAAVVVVCVSGTFAVAAALAPAATPRDALKTPRAPAAPNLCLYSWESFVREDGTAFTSGAKCVAYAAQGGTLVALQAQASCTLGLGTQAKDQLIWTCTAEGTLIERLVAIATFSVFCNLEGGRFTVDPGGTTTIVSCYRR
jgi:hypothetical protein